MLNERSDVYSFGVLVMEMITGRTPVDYTRPTAEVSRHRRVFLATAIAWASIIHADAKLFQVNLVEWLKRMVAERRVEEVVDPRLPELPPSKVLKRAVLAALRCVDPDGGQRPTMGHVVHMLEDDLRFRDVRRAPQTTRTDLQFIISSLRCVLMPSVLLCAGAPARAGSVASRVVVVGELRTR
jgi:serine/threonine protein kinase